MELIITPSYSEIFEEDKPTLESLLDGISSEAVILLLCLMNAKLYSENRNLNTQVDLFNLLTSRQSPKIKDSILKNIFKNVSGERQDQIDLFTPLHCLEFIHLELIHFRDIEIDDISPEKELKILKAYFIVVEIVNQKYSDAYKKNNEIEDDFFRKNTWPMLANQIEAATNSNYSTAMIKGIATFNFLEYHSPFSIYVKKFLEKHNKATSWNYMLDLMNLLKVSWDEYKRKKDTKFFFPISFEISRDYESLFKNFEMDIKLYQEEYKANKRNYTGLKEKPLFYSKSYQKFIVINWNFVSNKLYDGLLFDFYKGSEISKESRFQKFIAFKNYISYDAVEKFIFRRLIGKYLDKSKYHTVLFSEEDSSPDCYCRNNKTIFLVELKDAFFPALTTESLSYHDIKNDIDKKFNSEKKGTGQLIKFIRSVSKGFFQTDDFSAKGSKCRNMTIYPIIVYTDKFYSMQGVNNYLKNEFDVKLKDSGLDKLFKCIKPLVCIEYNFLLDLVDKADMVDIDKTLDVYNEEIKKRNKKLSRPHNLSDFFAVYDNFETVFAQKFPAFLENRENFVKTIFNTLNLTEGLSQS